MGHVLRIVCIEYRLPWASDSSHASSWNSHPNFSLVASLRARPRIDNRLDSDADVSVVALSPSRTQRRSV